jgi:hypothetical protein
MPIRVGPFGIVRSVLTQIQSAWYRCYLRLQTVIDTRRMKDAMIRALQKNPNLPYYARDEISKDLLGIPRSFDDWDHLDSITDEDLIDLWTDYIRDNKELNGVFRVLIEMWLDPILAFHRIPKFILDAPSAHAAYMHLIVNLTPDLIWTLFYIRYELQEMNVALNRYGLSIKHWNALTIPLNIIY